MTPAARVQAAIDILDLVITAARENGPPADRIVAGWFRSRRFAGSSDRRGVRELVYGAIRSCGDLPADGRAAMLRLTEVEPHLLDLFDGSNHAPRPIAASETPAAGGIAPAWLETALAGSGVEGEEAASLLTRAPLDIRVNTLKSSRDSIDLPVAGEATAAPDGLRLPTGTPVEQWDVLREGLIDVQDSGSQLASTALEARPGETVVDLCAGAGGKTLALAAAMGNRGRLIACDTDRGRLSRLLPRAAKAGVTIAETVLLNPGREAEALAGFAGQIDAVLVDAPCSGTGTWRRNPEARWRLNDQLLARHTALQARLLDLAAVLVAEQGRLVYVTCSMLDAEGAHQADAFLERHSDWKTQMPTLTQGEIRGKGLRLSPFRDGTDGFFIARFIRL
ncbi:MAG: RsmB/NOP family class I SAM-dependent RNA methyltransferase [Novosphingobium sp.]|nr:RsmB/NOP family class I SAM-dependent RNA methyltransferase [Novosphingobium sp.]